MFIDTHCHLDAAAFDVDRNAVLEAAQAAGVRRIIVPSVDFARFPAVHAVCRRYSGCYPAYGLHPLSPAGVSEQEIGALRTFLETAMASELPPVALGEIGLDGHFPGADLAQQEIRFIEQLKLAREFDLPVLLHVRKAIDPVLHCLRRTGVRRGIAHAFNGSLQQAEEFIRRGFCLGFGGAMTFPRARRIRALAAALPIEAIVLETDAPDMPPAWLTGSRNDPAELPRIAAVLAELRGKDIRAIAAATSATAMTLFSLPPEPL